MSGAAYNVPSVLSAGIDRGEVDSVFVINPSIFPPSAYELAVFKKPALGRYREALKKAGARQTSWDIAMHLAKSEQSSAVIGTDIDDGAVFKR